MSNLDWTLWGAWAFGNRSEGRVTPAQRRKAIDEFLDGLGVCHVCGDVLEIEAGDVVWFPRCVPHAFAVDEEGGEPWHIPAEEWKRRLENYKKARGK